MRRRSLLAGSAAALAGVLVPRPHASALASFDAGAIAVTARQVDHESPAAVCEVAAGVLTSPVVSAGQLFERVGAHFRSLAGTEGGMRFEVRASPDGTAWSEWGRLPIDPHLVDATTNTHYMPPQVVPRDSRYAQYRVWLAGARPEDLLRVSLTLIDASDLNAPLARLARGLAGTFAGNDVALAAPAGPSRILTRQDWSADESLMKWPPDYVPWQKAVVHHTVTSDGGSDVAAEIRAIYHFHAVTRGWGDIGYSYIVDKYGNIWTGRQGGEHAVAGHAYGWNDGTIGIAALGDYSVNAPTAALQGAIANIVAMRFRQLGIPPFGSGSFTHHETKADGTRIDVTTTVPNVVGHRDCTYEVGKPGGQTSCPGTPIYGMLDGLRSLAQQAWQQGYTTLPRLDPQLGPAGVAGSVLNVAVSVTNSGTVTIPAGTSVNYRILRAGSPIATGAGVALPTAVAPGARTTVQVPLLVPAKGEYVVRWDLQTGSAWWNQVYGTPVRDQWFRAADWSARWVSDDIGNAWTAGEIRMVTVTAMNDGGRTWNAAGTDPVVLGYYWISTSTGQRIEGATKLPLPQDVQPGASVTLRIPVLAPQYPAGYTLVVDLWKTNEFWFKDRGIAPDDTPISVAVDFKAQYTLPSQPQTFESGQTLVVPVTVANAGRGIFPAGGAFPVDLGYHWYDGGGRAIVWDGARTTLGADLAPGAKATLNAKVTAPAAGGQYQLKFDLVQEGVGWFSDKGVAGAAIVASVAAPVVPVYGATYQPGISTLAFQGGVTAIPFAVVNRSNFTWPADGANPVHLSYHWLDGSGKVIAWEGLRTTLPAALAPGASATLQAQLAFPAAQGRYTLRWDLVHEGVAWFSGKGVPAFDQSVVVGPRAYGGSIDVSAVPASLAAGATVTVPVRVQNLSNFDWDSFVYLSYHWYDATGTVVVWEGARTTLAGLRVNEVRALDATVAVPAAPGAYTLKLDIVQEGVAWFSGQGMQLAPIAISVDKASYGAEYATQPAVSAAPGATAQVAVAIRNTGGATWQPGAVNLSYHLLGASGAVYVWDGLRTKLAAPVKPGQTVVVNALVKAPATAGTWTIALDMVEEGVAWFSSQGVRPGEVALTVA